LDVIYEENDYLRKVLGWLSGQEPQLKIMIEEFKRADGRGLGFEKLGEKVGENIGESVYEKCVESNPEFEVIGDIQVPLPKAPKNSFTPKPNCRMDLPGPTTSVGTRTDYSVGPWDYPACATWHLKAWSTRTTEDKYSVRKLYMSRTVWKTPRRTRLVLSPYSDL
jgi:hypothetical protein